MTQKIYRLSLAWQPVAMVGDLPGLEILLDDAPFLKMLRDWEDAHESDEAKKITGHGPMIYYHKYYLQGWLNQKLNREDSAPPAKASLLGCTCGELGCWPLETTVTLTAQTAIWSDFFQPFRPEATIFDGFGPFTFDRAQYEAEVRKAIAQASA